MSGLRLVMVSSRYWPLVGEAERFLTSLAVEFHRQGAQPTIVSARWESSWPAKVTHRQIPVVRLPSAPRGGWSTFRYLRDLSRWLRAHSGAFDLVYVGNLRHEAYTAVAALEGRQCPTVLRAEAGDCRWQMEARLGRRIRRRCQSAASIIAHTESTKQELQTGGYAANQIELIPPGARVPGDRTAKSRYQARLALGDANHDLSVADYAPIVVCVERLEAGRGLNELIAAWQAVANRWPSAKLWIIGDGTGRSRLYESIVDRQLHHQVFLPGSFDELDDVFQAADLYVAPAEPAEGTSTLLAAMAAGLPVIAAATSDNRAMIDAGVHGLLIPPGDEAALSVAIGQLLESPSLSTQLGDAARRRVDERYSLARVAQDHLGLFARLAASQRGKR